MFSGLAMGLRTEELRTDPWYRCPGCMHSGNIQFILLWSIYSTRMIDCCVMSDNIVNELPFSMLYYIVIIQTVMCISWPAYVKSLYQWLQWKYNDKVAMVSAMHWGNSSDWGCHVHPKLCLTEQRRLDNHRGVRIRVSVRPLLMLDTGKNSHTELHSIIQYH